MQVRFWIKSSRGTNTQSTVTLPDWEGFSEKEREANIKDRLEQWCENFGAWQVSENSVQYGFEVLQDSQIKLNL